MTITGSSFSRELGNEKPSEQKGCQTEALVLFKPGDARIVEISIPELKPGQVLVKLAYSGICGSQILEIEGEKGPDSYLPHTLGHEGSGIVQRVGHGVTKVKPGDHVVLSWLKGEGLGASRVVYESLEGRINGGGANTLMRQTVACENQLVPIPVVMPLREAALLGCSVPTGMGTVLNIACVKQGESIVVFGVGGVGLLSVIASKFVGAYPIIVVDKYNHKLESASKLGATHTVNFLHEDPVATVRKITNGEGADYSISTGGEAKSVEGAFQAIRRTGGLCVVVGNLRSGTTVSIDPFDLIRGKRIVGSWGGDCDIDRDLPWYADLLLSGQISFGFFREYQFREFKQAVADLKSGAIQKALLHMEDTSRFGKIHTSLS